jgi:hypothetical protein
MSLDNSYEYQNKSNFLSNPGSGNPESSSGNILNLNEDYFTEEYEKDEELEDYLLINERVNTIYDYIKKISKNNIYPLFDKISYSSLLEFLYSSVEIDDKFLF